MFLDPLKRALRVVHVSGIVLTDLHLFVADFAPLFLGSMVQDSLQCGAEPLKLAHPVGQGRQRGYNHEGPVDVLLIQMRQESNCLDLHDKRPVAL